MVRKEELVRDIESKKKLNLDQGLEGLSKDDVKKIKKILSKNKKVKGEKKVKGKKVSKGKLKKGYVMVWLMKNNNNQEFRKLPVVNNNLYLSENDTFHLADTEYIGLFNGKIPIVCLPEWSNEPLTKEVLTRKLDENKSTIKPQKQIIHLMEDAKLAEQIKPKRSAKSLMVIIVIGIIAYVLARQMGLFGAV